MKRGSTKPIHFELIEPEARAILSRVSRLLTRLGVRAYLVGGFVRDVVLGRETADIDIAITADALEVTPQVATTLGGKYVRLDEGNRIGRVVRLGKSPSGRQWQLDLSTFRGSLEQDLARRDFSIDALAVELAGVVEQAHPVPMIDPFHGADDLKRGVVRVVSASVFAADAARLLRAVRLAAELGFSIHRETERLIRDHAYLIATVAKERVREELLQLLTFPGAGQITYLDALGLLTAMIPELAEAKGVTQPREHHWDVFAHSLATVAAVDFLLRRGTWEHTAEEILKVVPWSAVLAKHFELRVSYGSNRRLMLKLAALLHDIAKPQAKTIEPGGRMRFLGHAQQGALVAADILERLRFSTKEMKLVEVMIRHHLRPMQMGQDEFPTSRAIYRYFRDTEGAGFDILYLSLADHLATRGPRLDLAQWCGHARVVEYILTQHFREESRVIPPKLVSGHDLSTVFKMKPGPKMGEVLEALREAQATGKVATRDEALTYIGRLLTPAEK